MSKNQYGLDHDYFERKIAILHRDGLRNWRSDELARELARMSRTADKSVILEPEFETQVELAALREELAGIKESLAYRGSLLGRTEQRNSSLVELLREVSEQLWQEDDSGDLFERIDAAIKPTESGASE